MMSSFRVGGSEMIQKENIMGVKTAAELTCGERLTLRIELL